MAEKGCQRCKKPGCIGWVLFHPKEVPQLEQVKKDLTEKYGEVTFEFVDSPSSGEIFTKFKELHVFKTVLVPAQVPTHEAVMYSDSVKREVMGTMTARFASDKPNWEEVPRTKGSDIND